MDLSRRTFLAAQGAALGALLLPGGLLPALEATTPTPPSLDDWAQVWAQFHLSKDFLHFAGFFIASHPEPVRAAIEAFRMHRQIGPARIADRVFELNDRCRRGLAALPKVKLHPPLGRELAAGITCFDVAGLSPAAVVKALLAKRIVASTSPYTVSYARLSAGLMNTPEDVDRAVAAVARL